MRRPTSLQWPSTPITARGSAFGTGSGTAPRARAEPTVEGCTPRTRLVKASGWGSPARQSPRFEPAHCACWSAAAPSGGGRTCEGTWFDEILAAADERGRKEPWGDPALHRNPASEDGTPRASYSLRRVEVVQSAENVVLGRVGHSGCRPLPSICPHQGRNRRQLTVDARSARRSVSAVQRAFSAIDDE